MRNALRIVAAVATVVAGGPPPATERTVTLAVDNMTCETCPPIVRKSLARIPGVAKADISAKTGTATVVFDDTVASVDVLVAARTNAGYPSRLVR
jgi:periplasmic mercuric ion binding protein